MSTCASANRVRVVVPATTANLGAGFDVLAMALGLHVRLEARPAEAGSEEVGFRDGPRGELAATGRDMVREAMAAGLRLAGREGMGYELAVWTEIPVARGLGSSGALRVACLMAAGCMGEAIPLDALAREAAGLEGHPDNAVGALVGGLVVAASGGGELKWAKVRVPEPLVAVVAVPEGTVSTEESRGALPRTVPMEDAIFTAGRAALFVAALGEERFDLLGEAMEDRLHQPYRMESIPGAAGAMRAARAAGAKGAALSGSGPSVVALCDRREGSEEAVAGAMAAEFEEAGVRAECLTLAPDNEGARVELRE